MPRGVLLEAFVPPLVRARLAAGRVTAAARSAEWIPGAVLMVDLSGFSALAERLAGRGARGAEDLKDLLNFFFGRLVDLVHEHGGHILCFPGDGALILWPTTDDETTDDGRRTTDDGRRR